MKNIILIISAMVIAISGCELDGFLFNSQKQEKYSLPDNNIPDSLIEQVTFMSENCNLYGFWVKSSGTHTGMTLLYHHGNKHSIDEYWNRIMLLHETGVNVFVYDYRGYGMSEGQSSEKNMQADAEAALEYVLTEKNANPDSLCFYGYSLGNYASIYLAANKFNPYRLIAESPFASANSLTQGSLGLDMPSRWLTEGEFNNADNVKKIKTVLFLIHGEDDDFVRYRDNGKIVFDNAPEPKSLFVVPKANHTNIPQTLGTDEYKNLISGWLFGKLK